MPAFGPHAQKLSTLENSDFSMLPPRKCAFSRAASSASPCKDSPGKTLPASISNKDYFYKDEKNSIFGVTCAG